MHMSIRRGLVTAGLAAAAAIPLLALGGVATADTPTPSPTSSASATASPSASATATPGPALQLQAGGGETGITVELFTPGSVTVQTGTVVTWKNPFGEPHTVTFGNPTSDPTVPENVPATGPVQYNGTGYFSSGLFAPGFSQGPPGSPTTPDTFSVAFTKAGQYNYFCAIHTNMHGTVNVVDSGATDSQATVDGEIQTQYAAGLASLKALQAQQPTTAKVSQNANGTKTYTVTNGADNPNGDLVQFIPAAVNIAAGDTVTWDANTITPHTVTFNPDQFQGDPLHTPGTTSKTFDGTGLANSGIIAPADDPLSQAFTSSGTSFSLTFTKPGIYKYICLLHADEGMVGSVNVSAAAAPSPTATAPATTAPKPPNTGSGTNSGSGASLWVALGLAAALLALTGAGMFAVKRQG